MKTSIFIIAITSNLVFAQTDTLVFNNEKLACEIKEITTDAVKYNYPEESFSNSMYKNIVQKIIFKNGRIQTFTEASKFKNVKQVTDYENVTITQVENEVNGLFKLGDVSAKARGTTFLSNQERVKERAYRKFKMQAALQGGNSIYLTHQRSNGIFGGNDNFFGNSSNAETNLTGVVYSNVIPNFNEFEKLIAGKNNFIAIEEWKLYSSASNMEASIIKKSFKINEFKNENGLIMVDAQLECVPNYSKFRVVSFSNHSFTVFYESKNTQYNLVIKL